MSVTYRHRKIDVETPGQVQFWSEELGVSVHELVTALSAVGDDLEDVKGYLAASRESVGGYIDKMRARLTEIEVQFQQLSEERRSIVSFLEGFAQVQRSQRSGNSPEYAALTASPSAHQPRPRQYEARTDEPPLRHVHRSVTFGSSAVVVETVYGLLADGKRRSLQEILSFLEIRGIPLKGTNPSGFLSTLLSRDPRFDANRRDGWGLSEPFE